MIGRTVYKRGSIPLPATRLRNKRGTLRHRHYSEAHLLKKGLEKQSEFPAIMGV